MHVLIDIVHIGFGEIRKTDKAKYRYNQRPK